MMKLKNIKSVLFAVLILGGGSSVWAQNSSEQEQAQVEEVTIIGEFNPITKEAYKIRIKPVVKDETVKMPVDNYTISSKPVLALPELGNYKAAPLPKYKLSSYDKNYVRLGFGNYITPLAEFYANTQPSRSSSYSLHLKHLSSQGGIADYPDNSFSNNIAQISGRQLERNWTFDEQLWFKRQVVHYYGFPTDFAFTDSLGNVIDTPIDDLISGDSIKQRFIDIGANFMAQSSFTRNQSPINYTVKLGYDYFYDYFKTFEHTVDLELDLLGDVEFFNFSRYQQLGFNLAATYWENGYENLSSTGTLLVEGTPYFAAEWDEYSIQIGAKVAFTNDSVTNLCFYPAIKGSVMVIPDNLQLFVGIGGGMQRNSFRSQAQENPFIDTHTPLNYTDQMVEISGGIASKILPSLSLNIDAKYGVNQGYNFFVNTSTSAAIPGFSSIYGTTFTTLSDDVNVLDLGFDATYFHQQLFALKLGGRYYSYDLSTLDYAYHKPDFKLYLSGEVHPIDKLRVELIMSLIGSQYALDRSPTGFTNVEMDGTFDLNLHSEYQITEELTAFLQLNNLLNQQYEIWYNYPTQGFNVMGGVTYSF